MMDTKDQMAKVRNRVPRIHRLLKGLPPETQGCILADLLATFLAGHHPAIRQMILDSHIELMIPLIAINERMLFGPSGHPGSVGATASTKKADTTPSSAAS